MTMPDERTRSVKYAREFMRDLLDPGITPKVPKAIRQMASRVLRHFPGDHELVKASRVDPYTWGSPALEEKDYAKYNEYRAARAELYGVRIQSRRRSSKSKRGSKAHSPD